jgi:hypothetical protein
MSLSGLIALEDVPLSMGPTQFLPGSHRLTNHLANDQLDPAQTPYQHDSNSPEGLGIGSSADVFSTDLPKGSVVLFDDRVLHRGGQVLILLCSCPCPLLFLCSCICPCCAPPLLTVLTCPSFSEWER